jgi:hypothetical protein
VQRDRAEDEGILDILWVGYVLERRALLCFFLFKKEDYNHYQVTNTESFINRLLPQIILEMESYKNHGEE